MIEVKANGHNTDVNICGSGADLTAEKACILRGIYNAIAEENAKGAEMFAFLLKRIIDDPELTPFRSEAPREGVTNIRIDMDGLMRQMGEE